MSVKKVEGKLEFVPSIGGVATGLSSYVQNKKSIWVGWPGITSEELTEAEKQIVTTQLGKHKCYPVFLTKRQVDEFYNGFSNSVLWPVFHNLPLKEHTEYEQWWKTFKSVNRLFVDTILSLAQPDSTVWVHDYQLMLMPEMLRGERIAKHIGFFLHIPFPDIKTLNKISYAKQLLKGTLGADLVGFHTISYSENFIAACQELGAGMGGPKQVILNTRNVHVTNFPIGIDFEKYAAAGRMKMVKRETKQFRKKYGKRTIILAVDRLEPSKGLSRRLEAFRDFIEANPRFRNKVTMVMVAAPSRMDLPEYRQLKTKLEKLSSDINRQYGTDQWQPVDFINEALPFEKVNALYQLADIAFIAPLKDGMNLVAKEYVASKRKKGILILSQTAGAAEELRDALIVDPKKPTTVTEALMVAMTMPKRELKRRLKNMKQQIADNTVHSWASTFVATLQQPVPGTVRRTRLLRGKSLDHFFHDFLRAKRRLILLDYDGTLVPFATDYTGTKPPKRLHNLITALADNPKNEIVVISGRQALDLDTWFGGMNLNLVGEHGAVVRKAGEKKWQTLEDVDTEWKQTILPILQRYTTLTPRAMIETKPHSLVWHYRASPSYSAQKNAVILKKILKPVMKKYGVQLFQGNKILEVKDPRINKGTAVAPWLEQEFDLVIAIGDDYTDEDLFASLNDMAYTVKVGPGRTNALFRLKSVEDVVILLRRLQSK